MNKTLLIVDDEPSIRLILAHYFNEDFRIVLKSNGLEAMNWLELGNMPDAIVADYTMPVMDGLDFIKKVRAHPAHKYTPLVILSGMDETRHKIQCLKQGADDYVVKPFNPEELDLRVKKLMVRALFKSGE